MSTNLFAIKRFDPSQPAAAPSASAGVSDLAAKIEERRKKRKAGEAGLGGPDTDAVSEPAYAAPASAAAAAPTPAAGPVSSVVEEWKPAPGESPAEREKRIKREKRAQKLGVAFDMAPQGPSGSTYVPPPASYGHSNGYHPMEVDQSAGMGAGAIHPDRMGAPALANEVKEPKPPKEKTVAKANYLKKKKARAKGLKRGEPLAKPKQLKKAKAPRAQDVAAAAAAAGSGSDDSDSDGDDDGKDKDAVAAEKKRVEILKKKEERKVKRDAKKAELRALKADGKEVPAPTPRVLPTAAAKATATATVVLPALDVDAAPAEPSVEELEAAAEEAQRLARKESKRLKRSTRRLSPAPPSPSTLIPTQAPRSPSPVADLPPIQAEEPAPLLRLPSATRPAPPSAKTLSSLNVHASVRNKLVVDPETKLKIDDPALALSERGQARLGEMGIVEAFAGQCC